MKYGSVCSGIEAVTVAWEPLGFKAAWFSEIDPFCCALLSYRYPGVRNYGDFTKIKSSAGPVDILVGGTPCQSFSIAGKRAGLDDPRGNLSIEFCLLARRLRPRWVVFENVPGLLSSGGGRDFGTILGALVQFGYGCAWRVLDAQHFGVPQRRRRVFIVGYLGDWRRAAAVLFEPESLCGNTPTSRKAQQEVAGTLGQGFGTRGDDLDGIGAFIVTTPKVATTLGGGSGERGWCSDPDRAGAFIAVPETLVTHTLRGSSFNAGEDGRGRGTPLVPMVAFSANDNQPRAGHLPPVALCVQESQSGIREHETVGSVRSNAPGAQSGGSLIRQHFSVRRLTPRECERLQGFPDDYTLVPFRGKPACDSARYRAIGNAMAVPVMRWIGQRIRTVDQIAASNA